MHLLHQTAQLRGCCDLRPLFAGLSRFLLPCVDQTLDTFPRHRFPICLLKVDGDQVQGKVGWIRLAWTFVSQRPEVWDHIRASAGVYGVSTTC